MVDFMGFVMKGGDNKMNFSWVGDENEEESDKG